jgi:hypothetical protein
MEVVPFDEGKAVAHGTSTPYMRAAVVPELAKLSNASFRGLFDLVNLATWKSSLSALDFVHKISISAHREIKERICTSLQ